MLGDNGTFWEVACAADLCKMENYATCSGLPAWSDGTEWSWTSGDVKHTLCMAKRELDMAKAVVTEDVRSMVDGDTQWSWPVCGGQDAWTALNSGPAMHVEWLYVKSLAGGPRRWWCCW